MRHRKAGLKLNRTASHREAMFRNMVTSLFKHDRIRTTGAKAKEIRRWADHLITLAKRGDLHARRQALAIVREKEVVHRLFEQADERYGSVAGGYTRIVKLGNRPGDAAPMSLVELIFDQDTKTKKAKKKKAKTAASPKKKAISKKAPTKADDLKSDEKTATSVKSKPESAVKKEADEAKIKKKSVEKDDAKAESVAESLKEEKPEKKAKTTPKKQAATAVEKDASDTAEKKKPAEKTGEDEK